MSETSTSNYISPLSVKLLEKKNYLSLIDHWAKVLSWPNGWHYDLDICWIISELESLTKGRAKNEITILDAGGGFGLTQFILASLGYNVISLDFTKRQIPELTKGIFKIDSEQGPLEVETHPYQSFMNYGQTGANKLRLRHLNPQKIVKNFLNFRKFLYTVHREVSRKENFRHYFERRRDHSRYGKITFLRGTFNKIPLANDSVDFLVSVSAFEHNTYEDMPASVDEFMRVTKKGGNMLVTTSLAKDKDWFFQPSLGWNLTTKSLASWFNIPAELGDQDFDRNLNEIRLNSSLRKRVPTFYKYAPKSGLPGGDLSKAEYIPVGIKKYVEK